MEQKNIFMREMRVIDMELKVGMKAIIVNSQHHADYNFQICEIKEIEDSHNGNIFVEIHSDKLVTNFYAQRNELIPLVYENPEDLKKYGTTVDDISKLLAEYKGYYDLICSVADDISRESDEKDKKIEKLKKEKFRDESTIEKFRNDFQIFDKKKIKKLESDIEDKNCQIADMQKRVDSSKIELPQEPIKVAEMLIYAQNTYETSSIARAFGAGDTETHNLYSKSDLRQIAEHLLVYCNNEEDE